MPYANPPPCSLCARPTAARGLCDRHYRRLLQYGDPLEPSHKVRATCRIDECSKLVTAHGLCAMHRRRDRLYGDPSKTGGRKPPSEWSEAERFWAKVEKTSGCWYWRGKGVSNYGTFTFKGTSMPAHRWAYTAEYGPIPRGKVIDHLCRRHNCVRPQHMEAVTIKENVLRGVGQGAMYARRQSCANGHRLAPSKRPGRRWCPTCRAGDLPA